MALTDRADIVQERARITDIAAHTPPQFPRHAWWRTGLVFGLGFIAIFLVSTILHYFLADLDQMVKRWLWTHTVHSSYRLIGRFSLLGKFVWLLPITFGLIAWWSLKKNWSNAAILTFSMLAGGAVTYLVKLLFSLHQIFSGAVIDNGLDLGFPSGHAATAIIFWGGLAFISIRGSSSQIEKVLVALFAGAIALLVGISRLVIGVHLLTDVLGGWAFGGLWLTLTILLCEFLRRFLEPQNT